MARLNIKNTDGWVLASAGELQAQLFSEQHSMGIKHSVSQPAVDAEADFLVTDTNINYSFGTTACYVKALSETNITIAVQDISSGA